MSNSIPNPNLPSSPRLSTSLGHIERVAAHLDHGANRSIINWQLENPSQPLHHRSPSFNQTPLQPGQLPQAQSLLLSKLPDELIEIILDYLQSNPVLERSSGSQSQLDPLPPTDALLTNWSHSHPTPTWPELQSLSTVCKRLALLTRPRLLKEICFELKPSLPQVTDLTRPIGCLESSQFHDSFVWIKGIENLENKHWIRHLSLSDGLSTSGYDPLLTRSDLATLLNILSDNLQILVLDGSSVGTLLGTLDTEPLTRFHSISCLKLHDYATLTVDWLVLCAQKFLQLRRLVLGFDCLRHSNHPGVRQLCPSLSALPTGGMTTGSDSLPRTPLSLSSSTARLEQVHFQLNNFQSSILGMAQLLEINRAQMQVVSMSGRLTWSPIPPPKRSPTLATMLSKLPVLEKFSLALGVVVKCGQLTNLAVSPQSTSVHFVNSLLDVRLPRLRTLALTLSSTIIEPRMADVDLARTPHYEIDCLGQLWQSPLITSPHLSTLIVRMLTTVFRGFGSVGFVAPINQLGHCVPNHKPDSLRRLGMHLGLQEYRLSDYDGRSRTTTDESSDDGTDAGLGLLPLPPGAPPHIQHILFNPNGPGQVVVNMPGEGMVLEPDLNLAGAGGGGGPTITYTVESNNPADPTSVQSRLANLALEYNSRFDSRPSTIELRDWCRHHDVRWIPLEGCRVRASGLDLYREI